MLIHAVKKPIWQDIRFYVLALFLLRFYGITQPPIEVTHNWRQTTVTMAARNFLEVDNNILYPRIDFAGELSGITGMEFPVLNYLIYLLSLVFGYEHWYGRLIVLVFSSIGIIYFYKLLRKYFDERVSFYSSLILLCSLWFSYSRKVMPDTFSASFIIMALYYGTNYLEGRKRQLLSYIFWALIGLLSKLPSGYLFVLFIPFMLQKDIGINRKLLFSLASVILLVPVAWWYFIWFPHLVKEYGFYHFFMGESLSQGFKDIIRNWDLTLEKFYFSALKHLGFAIFVIAAIALFFRKDKRMLTIFTLSTLAFSVIMLKAGSTFSRHAYYIVPYVPVMALMCGYSLARLKNYKVGAAIAILICLESIGNQLVDFRISEKGYAIIRLEKVMDRLGPRSEKIVINSGEYPTPMYFAHRKGWLFYNDYLKDANHIYDLKRAGARHIIILKGIFGTDLKLPLKEVYDDNHYRIYTL